VYVTREIKPDFTVYITRKIKPDFIVYVTREIKQILQCTLPGR